MFACLFTLFFYLFTMQILLHILLLFSLVFFAAQVGFLLASFSCALITIAVCFKKLILAAVLCCLASKYPNCISAAVAD